MVVEKLKAEAKERKASKKHFSGRENLVWNEEDGKPVTDHSSTKPNLKGKIIHLYIKSGKTPEKEHRC